MVQKTHFFLTETDTIPLLVSGLQKLSGVAPDRSRKGRVPFVCTAPQVNKGACVKIIDSGLSI
jgi:hypothetical protein